MYVKGSTEEKEGEGADEGQEDSELFGEDGPSLDNFRYLY